MRHTILAPAAGHATDGGRRMVIVHPEDSVATVLDTETTITRLANGQPCAAGVPFGHKVAIRPLHEGAPVVKYGVTIGNATQPIEAGEHVHVHNCR